MTSSSSSTSASWQLHQDEAKISFHHGNFFQAFSSYQQALNLLSRRTSLGEEETEQEKELQQRDKSILLSNIVACRLKMGGSDNLAAALEEAQQCILLNDKWPKGYVRLASVYLALGNHSNDACQALQTALRLDPSNSFARSMLIQELRRNSGVPAASSRGNHDSAATTSSSRSMGGNGHGHTNVHFGRNLEPSNTSVLSDDMEVDVDDANYSTSYTRWSTSTSTSTNTNNVLSSWFSCLHQFVNDQSHKIHSWYNQCTENTQQTLKILAGLIILYIAFGGRFGLEYILRKSSSLSSSPSSNRRGNYGHGNAYERFYNERSSFSSYNVGDGRQSSGRDNHHMFGSHHHSQQVPVRNEYNHHYDYGMDYNMFVMIVIMLTFLFIFAQQPRQMARDNHIHFAAMPGIGMGLGLRRGGWMGGGGRGGFGMVPPVYVRGFHIPIPLGGRNGMFRRQNHRR